jgi:hypothetical protein
VAARRARARARFGARSNHKLRDSTPLTQRQPQTKMGWSHVKSGQEFMAWLVVFSQCGNALCNL